MRWFALVLIVAVVPQRAHAGGSGVVVLAAEDADAIADAFTAAMRSWGVGRIVANACSEAHLAVAAGAEPIETLARFRRIRDEIAEGWRAYHNVQFEAAASAFASARSEAQALLQVPGATILYADASLRLGVVLTQLERTAQARDALALALALDPERPISAIEFAPEVIALIDGVRAQPVPMRAVRLTTEPEGAVLNIDGRDAGRAPATVELSLGQHTVVARLPQQLIRSRVVTVTDASNTSDAISLALDPSDRAQRLAAGPRAAMASADQQSLIDDALQFADLDEVVVAAGAQIDGDRALLAQRCAGSPARCTAIAEVTYGDRSRIRTAAQTLWRDLRGADLRQPPSLLGDARLVRTQRGHGRCTVCRNPYVLAGVGAAIAVGTIAVVIAATASQPPPVVIVDPAAFTR